MNEIQTNLKSELTDSQKDTDMVHRNKEWTSGSRASKVQRYQILLCISGSSLLFGLILSHCRQVSCFLLETVPASQTRKKTDSLPLSSMHQYQWRIPTTSPLCQMSISTSETDTKLARPGIHVQPLSNQNMKNEKFYWIS